MSRKPDHQHIFDILDEIHDEYDASEFDARSLTKRDLHDSLNGLERASAYALSSRDQAGHRQLLLDLAAHAVAIVALIDDEEENDD